MLSGLAFSPGPATQRSLILVYEPKPYWTPELQRRFQGTGLAVRGFQKWPEFAKSGAATPAALGVVELEGNAAEMLSGLARWRCAGRIPLIVLSRPGYAELEWVLREAGVSAYFPDLPTSDDLARCCRRWL